MPMIRTILVAAAALVDADGRVLVQRRPEGKAHGGLWEFPGGKVEPGETCEQALVRELSEELAITVDVADAVPVTFATTGVEGVHLILLLYVVRRWEGVPQALEASALAWHAPAALASLAMPPADAPLVTALSAYLG